MNKLCLIVLCALCLTAVSVRAEDNIWDRPPHPNGAYGYDESLPDLLNIKGLNYQEAKLVIVGAGWNPLQTLLEGREEYEVDAMSGPDKTVWNMGYHELQSCSGGMTYCAFLFQSKNGDRLRVVTKGEEWDYEPASPARVVGYRFMPKN